MDSTGKPWFRVRVRPVAPGSVGEATILINPSHSLSDFGVAVTQAFGQPLVWSKHLFSFPNNARRHGVKTPRGPKSFGTGSTFDHQVHVGDTFHYVRHDGETGQESHFECSDVVEANAPELPPHRLREPVATG